MSEMGFYSLPTDTLHKKTKKSRLKNVPAGYMGSFYRNLTSNVYNFLGSDFYGKIARNATRRCSKIHPCYFRFHQRHADRH